jgi:hypothetical protein
MLRVIQYSGNARGISYPVHPNDTFEPGMIAQFKVINNDIVLGVSDGRAPFGIIDDIRTTAFSAPVNDELVVIPGVPVFDGYKWVNGMDTSKELYNANIISSSFVADYPGLKLNPINGILRAPAGIELNYSIDGSPTPNAVRTRVKYVYHVPNIAGEDSTIGSGRVSVWWSRGIFQTDQYEMTAYSVNATLFVSSRGKLTTEQTMPEQPGVGMCIVPPSAHNQFLEFIWL